MKWISLAWRNIQRNRRRALICMLTVAVGSVSILSTAGYMRAALSGMSRMLIHSGLGHLQLGREGEFDGYEEHALQYGLAKDEVEDIQAGLSEDQRVAFSFRRVHFEGLASSGDRTTAIIGQGVDVHEERALAREFSRIVVGHALDEGTQSDPYRATIGEELARVLGLSPGDFLTLLSTTVDGGINAIDFEVVGIIRTGVPEVDRRLVMLPIATAQELIMSEKTSRLVVVLEEGSTVPPLERSFVDGLRTQFADISVRSWRLLAPQYDKLATIFEQQFNMLGLMLLSVVSLSGLNTLLMSVLERVPEMGTLRALGIPSSRLRLVFVIEAIMIGMIGSALGGGVAYLMAQSVSGLELMMPPPPGSTVGYPLRIDLGLADFFAVGMAMMVATAISAWLPTKKIQKLDVVTAVRHV